MAVSSAIFAALTASVFLNCKRAFAWEIQTTQYIQSVQIPGFDAVMHAVSWPGDSLLIQATAVAVICAVCWAGDLRREAGALAASGGGAHCLNIAMKWCVARPRPTIQEAMVISKAGFYGFPSGHVMFYTAFYGLLLILAVTRVRVKAGGAALMTACAVLVSLVGVSRIYLGAHWAGDVAAAYLLGFIWLAIIVERFSLYKSPLSFNARNGGTLQ